MKFSEFLIGGLSIVGVFAFVLLFVEEISPDQPDPPSDPVVEPVRESTVTFRRYVDPETGCNYLIYYAGSDRYVPTPRIDIDGQTVMGCGPSQEPEQ